ncbi:MAG: hypothetical protein BJ554DRAFT_5359, partial [Olpidium bornovanus]
MQGHQPPHHQQLHKQYHQNIHKYSYQHRSEREPHFFAPPFGPNPLADPKAVRLRSMPNQLATRDAVGTAGSFSASGATSASRLTSARDRGGEAKQGKLGRTLDADHGKKKQWAFEFQEAIEQSNAAGRLASALCASVATTGSMDASALRALKRLTLSPKCCKQIIAENTPQFLAEILPAAKDESTASFVVEILWNLLESKYAKEAATRLRSETCLSQLCELLFSFNTRDLRPADRHHRNEIIMLLILIARNADDAKCQKEFRDSGFFQYLLTSLTEGKFEELQCPASSVRMCSKETFTSKKLSLQLIEILSQDDSNLAVAIENGVLEYLHSQMTFDESAPGMQQYTKRQMNDLQEQTMSLLSSIVPRLPTQVITKCIPEYLHYMREAIRVRSESVNNAVISGDRSLDLDTLILTVVKLQLKVATKGKEEKITLGEEGAVENVLDHTQTANVQRSGLLLLASLCRNCGQNRQLFSSQDGILTVLPADANDTCERDSLLFAVVDCIWGTICAESHSEEVFFQHEGIFLLLDLLEVSSSMLRRHTLGCLLDLLENPKVATMHFIEWRSGRDSAIGVAEMLVRIWDEEEKFLGIVNGPHGSLNNRKQPLVSPRRKAHHGLHPVQWRVDGATEGVSDHGNISDAIMEIDDNLRGKIYGMFCKLGFDSFTGLPTEATVKLALVGEVWHEITSELWASNVRPISPDQACIEEVFSSVDLKADAIWTKQREIIRKEEE